MPVLKSLSFTALPKSANDPVQMRRAKFVARLDEQKLLLKDPNHVRTVQRWTKVDGERQATTKQQAVRPWWKTDPTGQVVMSMKFGAKPVEFERGKAGIVQPGGKGRNDREAEEGSLIISRPAADESSVAGAHSLLV
jgi:hypothetical protein